MSTTLRRPALLLLALGLAFCGLVLPAAPALAVPIDPAPQPVLTGNPVPGERLTIVPGEWAEDTTLSYEWLLDGVKEPGASGIDWQVRQQDIDVTFQVAVTGTKDGFDPVRMVSEPVLILGEQQELRPTPSVAGTPRYGARLTAVTGTWDAGVTLAYQWLRAGAPIADAVAPSYVPGVKDLGQALSVRVTGTKPGYSRVVSTSPETASVAPATFAAARATVAGKTKVGKTLTATVTGAPGAKVARVWTAGAKKVGTAAKLKLTKAMKGKKITLRVTLSHPGYVTRTLTVSKGAVKK